MPVSVVGHAVFGEDHQLTAMTTAGVVSKVLQHLEKPVLLQVSEMNKNTNKCSFGPILRVLDGIFVALTGVNQF